VGKTNVRHEKNRCSECYKKVLCAGSKSTRNILTNVSPNPNRARIETRSDPKSPARLKTLGETEVWAFCVKLYQNHFVDLCSF